MEIHIYTDGSCLGNPGPGGWGTLIVSEHGELELSGGEDDSTNNRMEMMAVLKAFERLLEDGVSGATVKIHSDSKLVVNTFNFGWKKKKNTDLWAEMERLYAELLAKDNSFSWQWVKGHAGHDENERVDDLAREEAERIKG